MHNLPVDFWDGDSLETITSHLGRLLKIDELTTSLSRSKFARVCIEIDLFKPLKQGFWLGDEAHRVFVVVFYEKLPTFCYWCRLVGHGTNNCNHGPMETQEEPQPSPCAQQGMEVRVSLDFPLGNGEAVVRSGQSHQTDLKESRWSP